jgi:glucose/arabinose dehydrogenase
MNFLRPLSRLAFAAFLTWPLLASGGGPGPDGGELYRQHCAICHGAEGQGIPGVFPPLAGSDFLEHQREKALKAPLEGLFGKITVNGREYQGGMPPVILKDEQIASVFAHVYGSWGNRGAAPSVAEIKTLRSQSKYPTYEALVASMVSSQLPAAPQGWTLKVAAEFSFSPVRLASHPDGEHVLILAQNGDIWQWKVGTQEQKLLFPRDTYFDLALGDVLALGLTVDREGRLYVTSNQCNKKKTPVANEVTVFRTGKWNATQGGWTKPESWLRVTYPFGIGPYNHGVSHIAQGPDGMMYINSGARTDGGEPGKQPNYDTGGENELTACMWRVDPAQDKPQVEVIARGLRNSFGFCWDDEGRMIATENGPDAEAPEELNVIEPGKHYGFPYQFADWTEKAYPHTPDLPAGIVVKKPLRNIGPDAGGSAEKGKSISTFDPHSCPSGIVWLGRDWPAPLGGSFLAARFGNLIKADAGYDVLQMRPDFEAGTTTVKRLLAPLGRPIDVLKLPGHRLLIAEYCRGTNLAAGIGTPGRVLVLEPAR